MRATWNSIKNSIEHPTRRQPRRRMLYAIQLLGTAFEERRRQCRLEELGSKLLITKWKEDY